MRPAAEGWGDTRNAVDAGRTHIPDPVLAVRRADVVSFRRVSRVVARVRGHIAGQGGGRALRW